MTEKSFILLLRHFIYIQFALYALCSISALSENYCGLHRVTTKGEVKCLRIEVRHFTARCSLLCCLTESELLHTLFLCQPVDWNICAMRVIYSSRLRMNRTGLNALTSPTTTTFVTLPPLRCPQRNQCSNDFLPNVSLRLIFALCILIATNLYEKN